MKPESGHVILLAYSNLFSVLFVFSLLFLVCTNDETEWAERKIRRPSIINQLTPMAKKEEVGS